MSVVPLLLGDSDSLSVSYGMEPEQEALSIVSSTERGRFPVNKLNPKFMVADFRQPYTTDTTLHGSGALGCLTNLSNPVLISCADDRLDSGRVA